MKKHNCENWQNEGRGCAICSQFTRPLSELKEAQEYCNNTIKELTKELKQYKNYCNALFQLVKTFLPACPAKSRKMWKIAIENGQKLAEKCKKEAQIEILKEILKYSIKLYGNPINLQIPVSIIEDKIKELKNEI